MTFCFTCFKKIDSLREPCPYCGAPALKKEAEPEPLPQDFLLDSNDPEKEMMIKEYAVEAEIHRLMKRGIECYNKGKAWLATKNKQSARKDFQRAVRYFDSVLKIDPGNQRARELRAKSMHKIS